MKKTFLGILPLFFLPFSLVSCSKNEYVKIVSVHDGDTFYDAHNNSYRLFGVDTAELSSPLGNNQWKNTSGIEREFGEQATAYTKRLIEGKEVKMIYMSNDIHGRKVVKVEINHMDLATELIKRGLARVAYIETNPSSPFYSTEFSYLKQLLDVQFKTYLSDEKPGFWKWFPEKFRTIFPKA